MSKGRPSAGPGGLVNGPAVFQPTGLARLVGRLPIWTALLVLAAGAVLGIVVTLIAGQEPGGLLGFFVVVGSIAAALGIKRGKVHLLFPAPALAFFVAAILVGKVHDANLGSSTAGLGAGFAQWVAGIFFPAVVATILVLLIGGGRWLFDRQLVTGQSMLAPGGPTRPGPPRGSARVPPGARQKRNDLSRDDWADNNPFGDQQAFKTEMIPTIRQDRPAKPDRPAWMGRPGGSTARQPDRPPRDQRTDRDPWGDPRLPPDRGQPPGTGPRSNAQPPGTGPRPNAQPRDRAPRPSANPRQRPPRPPRQPPEGWSQR
ncbi:MAG: DUF6542 domain-containing protein [Trebonia sp.]